MERIRSLINKLQQQSERNADASELMVTVQILQAELAQSSASTPRQMSTSKVAVMLPSSHKVSFPVREAVPEIVSQPQYQEYPELPKVVAEPVVITEPSRKISEKEVQVVQAKKEEQAGWLFNPSEEIPTLAHQNHYKERTDVFSGNGSSLNDRLKTEKKELASVLTDGPVRDLKKAIGINDRFVFLNELFRGDEAMYERSLKTINNFRIFPEAEYWIERELKVKLGWDENKDVVKHFRQLVKRRFL
jgi:hypothetical protein